MKQHFLCLLCFLFVFTLKGEVSAQSCALQYNSVYTISAAPINCTLTGTAGDIVQILIPRPTSSGLFDPFPPNISFIYAPDGQAVYLDRDSRLVMLMSGTYQLTFVPPYYETNGVREYISMEVTVNQLPEIGSPINLETITPFEPDTFVYSVSYGGGLATGPQQYRLYAANPYGGEARLLNESSIGHDREPAVSPDGKLIAFTFDADLNVSGDEELYLMSADGQQTQRLTFNQRSEDRPRWSPDGTKIAFQTAPANSDALDIAILNLADGSVTQLTQNGRDNRNPNWSPDGSLISFSANNNGDVDIYVMNADGSNVRQLTTAVGIDARPAFSPDGSLIAFNSERDGINQIYVMNADGSDQRLIVATGEDAPIYGARWSPDGRFLAYYIESSFYGRIVVGAINLPNNITMMELTNRFNRNDNDVWGMDWYGIPTTTAPQLPAAPPSLQEFEAEQIIEPLSRTGADYAFYIADETRLVQVMSVVLSSAAYTHVVDAETGETIFGVDGLRNTVITPDGQYLIGHICDEVEEGDCTSGFKLTVLDASTGDIVRDLNTYDAEGALAVFSDTSRLLRFGCTTVVNDSCTSSLEIMDITTGEILGATKFRDFYKANYYPKERVLVLSPDGTRAVLRGLTRTGYDTVILFDISDPAAPTVLVNYEFGDYFDLSQDGKYLAVSSEFNKKLLLYDTATGELIREQDIHDIESVAFSPDGTRLATTGWDGSEVTLWDTQTGEQQAELITGLVFVQSIRFSPDGTYLAAGGCFLNAAGGSPESCADGAGGVVVFTVEDGSAVGAFIDQHWTVSRILFTQENTKLLAGNNYGEWIYKLP